MTNETRRKCLNGAEHQFVCIQGQVGEIKRPISPNVVSQVLADSSKASTICPDGVIACIVCKQTLVPGQSLPTADLSSIRTRLG